MSAGAPDLAAARRLFHRRDPALDEPYGEGVELALYALPDGRLYATRYRYHVDFDGTHDDRVVSRDEAIDALAAEGASAEAAALFPAAPQARWFRRFGTCLPSRMDVERVAAGATCAWRTDGLLALADADGLWVLDRPGSDGRRWRSVEQGPAALAALLAGGCPLEVLARWFPDAAAVRLLRRVGASTWGAASASELPALMAPAARIGEDGSRLLQLGPGEHLLERPPGPEYEALDDVGAAMALLRAGAPADAWRRVFPDPAAAGEAVRALQRRAGVSFPAAQG